MHYSRTEDSGQEMVDMFTALLGSFAFLPYPYPEEGRSKAVLNDPQCKPDTGCHRLSSGDNLISPGRETLCQCSDQKRNAVADAGKKDHPSDPFQILCPQVRNTQFMLDVFEPFFDLEPRRISGDCTGWLS